MRTISGAVLALTLAAPVAAQAPQPAPSGPRQLAIAAASDLRFAMDEIVRDFQAVRPEVATTVTYGSSGQFFAQIESGAPFDMFFSADAQYTRRLDADGFAAPQSGFTYAIGRLALFVPASSALDLSRGLAVLRDPSVRKVAIANPRHAPYGRAAGPRCARPASTRTCRPSSSSARTSRRPRSSCSRELPKRGSSRSRSRARRPWRRSAATGRSRKIPSAARAGGNRHEVGPRRGGRPGVPRVRGRGRGPRRPGPLRLHPAQ